MDLASVVAALASVGVRVSGSTPNSSVQVDSSRACPTGLASPEPSGTINDPGQHFQVGSVIEWRRMAWSPGVISSHRSVLLWTAPSRGRSRNPLRSGVVRCCGGSSIVVMGWVRGSERALSCVVGGDGAWGISSSGCCGAFASCSSALMVAKTSGRVGEAGGWGAGSFQPIRYFSRFSELCCMVMAAVASSSGV